MSSPSSPGDLPDESSDEYSRARHLCSVAWKLVRKSFGIMACYAVREIVANALGGNGWDVVGDH